MGAPRRAEAHVGAGIAVCAALMFGNSAWAPTDVYVEGSLPAYQWATAVGHRVNAPTLDERLTVYYWSADARGWPARADGSPAAGAPCATARVNAGQITRKVIHAYGSQRVCY